MLASISIFIFSPLCHLYAQYSAPTPYCRPFIHVLIFCAVQSVLRAAVVVFGEEVVIRNNVYYSRLQSPPGNPYSCDDVVCADHDLCAGRLACFILACWVICTLGLADSALHALSTHYSFTDLQARRVHIAYPRRVPREKEKARRHYGVTCRFARTRAGALQAPSAYHLHAIYVAQDKHCEPPAPAHPDASIQMLVGRVRAAVDSDPCTRPSTLR